MRLIPLIALMIGLASIGRAQEPAFVVNKDTKVASLTADDVKNILLGTKLKFDDGTSIRLAVLVDGQVHEKVVRGFTQRSVDQFEKYWKRLVFTGKGIMAEQCKGDAEVIDYVSKNPGAFGYVDKSSVTPAVAIVEVK
jgi:ABC-type phosphate transport system substrate-binding protein